MGYWTDETTQVVKNKTHHHMYSVLLGGRGVFKNQNIRTHNQRGGGGKKKVKQSGETNISGISWHAAATETHQ